MEEEDFVGCISCMSTKDLCDLFAVYSDNVETYAQMLETCFDLKVSNDLKYICAVCVEKLETAATYKEQTAKSIAILQSIRDEEYLDESIFEDAESDSRKENKLQKVVIVRKGSDAANDNNDYDDEVDDEHAIQALDETCCIYCDLQLNTAEEVSEHIKTVHGLEPRTGLRLRECSLCGVALRDSASDHMVRCHGMKSEREGRQFPCHFCDNVYTSRKACFTHLRMKHGLKMCSDQTPKYVPRERKKCHMCNRDFSQKQILNKHLWKAHGFEVEKRKAFTCPLCSERVSYGGHFSEHLARCHQVREVIERLEFHNMDDFMLYKSAIQEETKYRFRKTTASKQTIEGVRSHYMCSQSGVYVYQGKGKRPAPERQIYKTGKACPAHMIVTETMDRVTVTFHKTHVGHGACPYYEPRDKKPKLTAVAPAPRPAPAPVPASDDVKSEESELKVEDGATLAVAVAVGEGEGAPGAPAWMCDACGAALPGADEMRAHMAAHGLPLYACRYCDNVYQSAEAWSRHETCDHGAVY